MSQTLIKVFGLNKETKEWDFLFTWRGKQPEMAIYRAQVDAIRHGKANLYSEYKAA